MSKKVYEQPRMFVYEVETPAVENKQVVLQSIRM